MAGAIFLSVLFFAITNGLQIGTSSALLSRRHMTVSAVMSPRLHSTSLLDRTRHILSRWRQQNIQQGEAAGSKKCWLSMSHLASIFVAPTHRCKDYERGSLAEYMKSLSLESLQAALSQSLPEGRFSVALAQPSGTAEARQQVVKRKKRNRSDAGTALVLTSHERLYLGPRVWGLWIMPQIVVWLQSQHSDSLEIETHYCGTASATSPGLKLETMHLRTKCFWLDESIHHLDGDSLPCLILDSELDLELRKGGDGGERRPISLRLVPTFLINRVCRRTLRYAMRQAQEVISRALLAEKLRWQKDKYQLLAQPV